ncbi:MAG TPA: hypothetical protein VE978_06855 [Chitinophagales bacterium]|nr:hypothetical protein [Chitinophagales bacterium]
MKIKHFFLFIVFFLALTTRVFSQDNFTEGMNAINFGVGFGNFYYLGFSGYGYHSTPALTLSLDHGLKKLDEIQGTIGIGGLVGFRSSSFDNYALAGHYHINNFIIAARATYHAGFINTQKFDLYGGIMVGIRIEADSPDLGYYGGGYLTGGAFVGGVYYFVSSVGAFAEIGYDVSYLKIGLTLKAGGH